MQIEIWSVGKENEHFIEEGIQYYFRKIKPWISVSLVLLNLPRKMHTTDIPATRRQEEDLILKKLKPEHVMILLDENGKTLSSLQWAEQFGHFMNRGAKTIVLLIGGAYGVTDTIKRHAAQTWSLSRLVFPHQLVRLLVAEQVYRSFSILHRTPYHHI